MQPRPRSFSTRMLIVLAGLLALIVGGLGAVLAQIGSAAPEQPRFLRPPYPEPQFIPAIVYQPPPPPTATPIPTPTPVVIPIFVGERNGWDGEGTINDDGQVSTNGTHLRRTFDQMIAADVIRSDNLHWYDPNPEGWEQERWYSHYRFSTGRFVSSTAEADPRWKWGRPWFLPFDLAVEAGRDLSIGGARFSVVGPYSGVTQFGVPVQYWKMVNRDWLLYWEDGPWKQYVLPGELELHYDAGPTGLLLFQDVMRRIYYDSAPLAYTVRYVDWLTVSNAFPETTRTADPSLSPPVPAERDLTSREDLSDLDAAAILEMMPAGWWLMGP